MAVISVDLPIIDSSGFVFLPSTEKNPTVKLGSVPLDRFSGELTSPLLNNSEGNIFFSPSFNVPNPNNSLFVQSIEEKSYSGDTYETLSNQPIISQRPFVFGPAVSSGRVYPPDFSVDYIPCFNQNFSFVGTTQNNAEGVFTDLMTMETTIIFY